MSGIFRNSFHNNSNKTMADRRTTFSAFSVSPGTLKDVTMDNSYGVGYRSPCVGSQGFMSGQGNSLREIEEQIVSLRKENFNLRLRVYFLEENVPGYNQPDKTIPEDTLLKQLVDYKVEVEMLRKDVQDKQELLKEAAAALTHMEEIANEKQMQNSEDNKKDCSQTSEEIATGENIDKLNNMAANSKISELEELLKASNEKINDFQNQISALDDILTRRDETIKEYQEQIKELRCQKSDLEQSLEAREREINTVESIEMVTQEMQEIKSELADKTCMLLEAEDEITSLKQKHEHACRNVQKLMLNLKSKEEEIEKFKQLIADGPSSSNKDCLNSQAGLNTLESTNRKLSLSDSEVVNDVSIANKEKLEMTIQQQKKTIQNLKLEIKKKTVDLQKLVNKELWEKNREIERLTKLLSEHPSESVLSPVSSKDTSLELKHAYSDEDYMKALERNKLLQRKVDVLIQRLGSERNNDSVIIQLRNELRQARNEAENADRWRQDCADVCTLLSNRLEELAGFLNSLLNHKDVLGFLAADRHHAMRKAVNRSLDLSKNLNITLSMTGNSAGDQSLLQLSNLSGILGDLNEGENMTYNSYKGETEEEAIKNLKFENKALKKELEKRRNDTKRDRRSLPIPLPLSIENQSESEDWSEPDRKVSLARIGLDDYSSSITKDLKKATDTDTDTNTCTQSRNSKTKSQDRIAQLEQIILERDERILEIQCQLVETDNRLKKENLHVLDMRDELQHLRKRNEELHADLITIGDKEPVNSLNESLLLKQIDEKEHQMKKLVDERDCLSVQIALSEIQIKDLKLEINEIKKKHEVAIKIATEEQTKKLENLQKEFEARLEERINEQERKHRNALANDWTERSLYEANKKQLIELQRQFVEAQRTIDYLNENEQELKESLVQSEFSARALKKQLDESTIQSSKTITERTKALNDKLQLEKQVQELKEKIAENEINNNILQKQLQQFKYEYDQLKTKFNSITRMRQNSSDVSNSEYTSEEIPKQDRMPGISDVNTIRDAATNTSRQNNQSPDLGIESDAGRVSSVEVTSTQHSKLKTVELSMAKENISIKNEINASAINDEQRQQPSPKSNIAQENVHDCAKVDQENAELRRKLLRTKRALEDTYQKLHISNQKKAQVEKDIKNQILKTHNVLKNVRSNMENEL
ncbi:centrosomin isoform X2 [Teleopsis dalmanni]|uniref:centrosomin isoform X2 n=1 Tax=Teleopsis dalmanni TaxID=139649 RepID=UPI0018CD4CCA|nr:centrosomin isoform X2 [Teleopsis dalmanni]